MREENFRAAAGDNSGHRHSGAVAGVADKMAVTVLGSDKLHTVHICRVLCTVYHHEAG